jgi:Retrotransposon gag protein/Zinc knuckle
LNTLKMSDISDTPNTSSNMHGGNFKTAKPDFYHGDRTKLEDWLLQMDLYFKFDGEKVDPVDKVSLATTYMRGPAAQWIKPYLIKYMDENNHETEIESLFENYDNFKGRIRHVFSISNEKSTSTRFIQHIKQRRSAAEYAATFQQHAVRTAWDDEALMTMYRRGLKDNVKEELMRHGGQIKDLDDLMQATIDIDDRLYELAMEKKRDHGSKGSYGGPVHGYRMNPRKATASYHDPDAMQIDNLIKGRGKPKESKFSGSKAKTCYNCGKPGHIARNCRSKNKVTRQLNVLTIDDGDIANDE